jgi:hypothetical protein
MLTQLTFWGCTRGWQACSFRLKLGLEGKDPGGYLEGARQAAKY